MFQEAFKFIKKIWHDPVLSKIIATAIYASVTAGALGTAYYFFVEKINIELNALTMHLSTLVSVQNWLLWVSFFLAFYFFSTIMIFIIRKFSKQANTPPKPW